MPNLDDLLAHVRSLTPAEKARVARELAASGGAPAAALPTLGSRPAAPHSVAWLKAERGHAVLATDTGPSDDQIPAGAAAIAGMWADMREEPR
jgi:hypothetical protein